MKTSSSQLKKGTQFIRSNVSKLMQPIRGGSRKKAIVTLAKKHNISRGDAQFRQAKAIALHLARKK